MDLKPETRCDFYIDEDRKRLFVNLLEIFKVLYEVCKKNDLKIFAAYGTELGLIRHKGYIPWDDDIDLYMLRSDYEKLKLIAKKELPKGYFLQTTYSDKIIRQHAQLRKDNTTMMLWTDYKNKHHRGAFIDIFVLDSVSDNKEETRAFFNELNKKYSYLFFRPFKSLNFDKNPLLLFVRNQIIYPLQLLKYNLKILIHGGRIKAFRKYDLECQRYNDMNTNYVSNVTFDSSTRPIYFNTIYKKEGFLNPIELPFEDILMPCSSCYEDDLKETFGEDYMKYVIGTSDHGSMFIDFDHDYKIYDKLSLKKFAKLFKK